MEDPKRLEEGLVYTHVTSKKEDENVNVIEGNKDGDESVVKKDREETAQVAEKNVEEQQQPPVQRKRVATLDAFRGLTVVVRNTELTRLKIHFMYIVSGLDS